MFDKQIHAEFVLFDNFGFLVITFFCYLLREYLRNIMIYSVEHKLLYPRTLLRASLELKCVVVSDRPLMLCGNSLYQIRVYCICLLLRATFEES